MNTLLFDELLYRLAIEEDLVAADVKARLRTLSREEPGLADYLKPQQQRLSNGQVLSIGIEDRADNMRKVWAEARPVERAAIRLSALEQGLRGRLIEALLELNLTAPGDVRDAVKQAQALQANQHPAVLTEALDFLRDAKYVPATGPTLADLKAEAEALYPPDPEDEDETPVPSPEPPVL